jgi:hypothetical protein
LVEAVEPRLLLASVSFEPAKLYPAGASPAPVTVGDFNRDGVNDLAVAGEDPVGSILGRASVRVLLGRIVPDATGTGTAVAYDPPSGFPYAGVQASGIVAADFNRDGNLDVAVSNDTQQGAVYVLLGKGDGTLAEGVRLFSGSFSTDLDVADLNRDGNADLVVSNAGIWTPSLALRPPVYGAAVLLGKGDGTFQWDEQMVTPGPQHYVETGDVNGDGYADAVFGRVVIGPGDFVAPRSEVFAGLGSGDGGLGLRETTTLAAAIVGMDAGDVNGDGRTDVALAVMHDFMSPGDAGVLLGRADGTFTPTPFYEAAPAVTDVAVADLNADGRPDLAVAGWNPYSAAAFEPGEVVALRNLGGATFGEARPFGFVGAPARLAAAPLNRDRLPDLAATITRAGNVAVLINNSKTISARGLRLATTRGVPMVDRPVARFAVAGPRPAPDAFVATILWGDGTGRSEGSIVANADGTYSVLGSHTYRRWGIFRITVYVRRAEGGETAMARSVARVGFGR